MTPRLHYGTPAKIFHWLVVALLAVQYPIGWLMPDIHRGMQPGAPDKPLLQHIDGQRRNPLRQRHRWRRAV